MGSRPKSFLGRKWCVGHAQGGGWPWVIWSKRGRTQVCNSFEFLSLTTQAVASGPAMAEVARAAPAVLHDARHGLGGGPSWCSLRCSLSTGKIGGRESVYVCVFW